MATQYPCAFSIDGGATGGRLSGGFPNGEDPTLDNGDSILVTVTCDASVGSGGLTGTFVFTGKAEGQGPSPFVNGPNSNFVCITTYPGTPSSTSDDGSMTYSFPVWSYGGNLKGSYELTFIATNAAGLQWSEDPEFETGN